jgi:hypothetical protein
MRYRNTRRKLNLGRRKTKRSLNLRGGEYDREAWAEYEDEKERELVRAREREMERQLAYTMEISDKLNSNEPISRKEMDFYDEYLTEIRKLKEKNTPISNVRIIKIYERDENPKFKELLAQQKERLKKERNNEVMIRKWEIVKLHADDEMKKVTKYIIAKDKKFDEDYDSIISLKNDLFPGNDIDAIKPRFEKILNCVKGNFEGEKVSDFYKHGSKDVHFSPNFKNDINKRIEEIILVYMNRIEYNEKKILRLFTYEDIKLCAVFFIHNEKRHNIYLLDFLELVKHNDQELTDDILSEFYKDVYFLILLKIIDYLLPNYPRFFKLKFKRPDIPYIVKRLGKISDCVKIGMNEVEAPSEQDVAAAAEHDEALSDQNVEEAEHRVEEEVGGRKTKHRRRSQKKQRKTKKSKRKH